MLHHCKTNTAARRHTGWFSCAGHARGVLAAAGLAVLLAGCVRTSAELGAQTLAESAQTAWSIRAASPEPTVAVSPAQRTLRLAGSAGTVLGTSITHVANDRYRRQLLDGLGDYDPGAHFEQRLAAALDNAFGGHRVLPMGSTAGYHSMREAESARFERLVRTGHDTLLDTKITHGLFGPSAVMVVSVEGRITTLPQGHRRYHHEIGVVPGPALADTADRDPEGGLLPDLQGNLVAVEEGAVARWLEDGAAAYREAFEAAAEEAVAALLCDLRLAEDARGFYQLGRQALRDGRPETALAHFDQALALDGAAVETRSARAVALAGAGRVDDAVAEAGALVAEHPDYGPAHYNLAWWYAVTLEQFENARTHREQAQALGMTLPRRVERALGPVAAD